ncbi:MAG: DUF6464 family protein [Nostoc sp.]|uniref:DUF6464 family protein n=1 Tax=Nostoc sp. TaxID=1180 RepID=UPI002FFB0E75
MNQIESILEFLTNCDLHLWSDATHEIDTKDIKHLLKFVIEQLDPGLLQVDAYLYQEWRNWTIIFRWRDSDGLRTGADLVIGLGYLERFRGCLNVLGSSLSDRIRISSTSNGELLSTQAEAYITGMAIPLFQIPTIGDRNCKYNARSQHLRCTINPSGPCDGCMYLEKI